MDALEALKQLLGLGWPAIVLVQLYFMWRRAITVEDQFIAHLLRDVDDCEPAAPQPATVIRFEDGTRAPQQPATAPPEP